MTELALKLIAENKAKHERGEDASYLDLGRCGLTTLPDLSDIYWLETLIVSNAWWDWEQRMWRFSMNKDSRNILNGNPVGSLPTSLRFLYMSGENEAEWKISNWEFLKGLTNLQALGLRYNQISNPYFLQELTSLQTLDLSTNQINSWEFLKGLTNLQALYLSFNQIRNLFSFQGLTNLRSIDLSNNQISNAEFLQGLANLQAINLSYNQISSWEFLKGLTNLQSLDLSGNQINNADFLKELTSLQVINLNSNRISNAEFLKELTNLQALDLSGNQINNVEFLKGLSNLQAINLSYNQLSNADFLKGLTNLHTINLSYNQLSNADFLQGLTNLQSLILSGNQISNVDFLQGLTNLQVLYLDSNQISNADFLQGLTNLQSINLNYNQLSNADFLKGLTNLQSIDLSNNQISNADFLIGLTNLQNLFLRNNQISNFEPFLQLIQKRIPVTLNGYSIHGIDLYKNPLTHPPLEILEQGSEAILSYFTERSKQQFKNTQIKLILLGNSTAGKTTLSCYLREQTYDPNQPTTHGIQNHRWQIPELDRLEMFQWRPDNKDMVVNIWDFGGQEYYHATHRLFLSRNAVYILLWDAKTDKGGIESTAIHYENDPHSYTIDLEHFPKAWWLKNLNYNLNKYVRHDREGEAPIPVLLVQNKCATGSEYEEKSMSREFEQKPYFLKPAWTKHHIDLAAAANEQAKGEQGEWTMRFKLFETELLKTLESQMATYEFAIYHRDIRDRVRALASGENPVNEMLRTDFEALCRDIDPEAKMDLVQIYLRDITGDILYFDQNERLKQRVFFRPDWVCNRIYAILSRKVLDRKGIFDLAWVCDALQCNEREALDFVELMREFQLVFEENNENGKATGNFVAPQYLPDVCTNPGELEGAKKYATLTHAFTLWFPEFLPKSHVARFVAHWGHQAKQRLFWKNGLLFQTDGCTVLVERYEESKIRVDVQMSHVANREKAIRRVFQSFLDLEDGQAGFAVSLNGQEFAFWENIQKAISMEAKQVDTYSIGGSTKFIELKPFFIFHKPINMAKKVFISYSHKDESFKDDLDTHFSALKRSGLVEVWHDRRIDAGTEWDDAIKSELESADIILLLVSANFLASEYIWKVEIARAMERHRAKEAKVIPIFTRSCDVKGMPFEGIQGLPRDAKPIATFTDKDEAYVQIAKGIRAILET